MALNTPLYGIPFEFYVVLDSRDDPGVALSDPPIEIGDVKVVKRDFAAGTAVEANIVTLPAVSPAGTPHVRVNLSAAEMQADIVSILFSDQSGGAWLDLHIEIAPQRVPSGSVDTASFTPTTTQFDTDLTEVTDNHYLDLYLYWLTGANSGLSRRISAYTGATKRITLATALPDAPAAGDQFVILGRSE